MEQQYLLPCKACSHQISLEVKGCPHCGVSDPFYLNEAVKAYSGETTFSRFFAKVALMLLYIMLVGGLVYWIWKDNEELATLLTAGFYMTLPLFLLFLAINGVLTFATSKLKNKRYWSIVNHQRESMERGLFIVWQNKLSQMEARHQ